MKNKYISCFGLASLLLSFQTARSQYGSAMLDTNDATVRFQSNGLIGLDPSTNNPNFFLPNTLGTNSPSPLFAAGLWIGGIEPNGTLRLAAERFEQNGHDFFPGPLGTNASIDSATSALYNVPVVVNRSDFERHIAYFDCLADPNCDETAEFPGYTVPASFYQWPANGDVNMGQDLDLAPYLDRNGDFMYNPDNGDAPCVPGDQAVFTIYNDKLSFHTETGGQPIGMEIHMTAFAYSSDNPAVDQTVFIHYRLINQGDIELYQTYIGLFNDFDLGCASDDYIQCDVGRNLLYVLNGDNMDQNCGHPSYGVQPPAFGQLILQGPRMDFDGVDNTEVNSLPGYNGSGFNDGIADNEHLGMGHFVYFNNASGAMSDPNSAAQYYTFLQGIWSDGMPLTYGGSGYSLDPNAVHAHFMYPGDSDPLGVGTNGTVMPPWTEASAGNAPGDRRGVASMGPFTFAPGQVEDIVIAYVYARAGSGGPEASAEALKLRVDSIRAFAQTIPGLLGQGSPCDDLPMAVRQVNGSEQVLRLFPNPATDQVNVVLPGGLHEGVAMLHDAQGRFIRQQELHSNTSVLSTENLAPGIYLLRVRAGGVEIGRSLVKARH